VSQFSSTWNREHLWPRSRGNADQFGPHDSDLFHVVPSDTQVNSLRSNRYFDWSDPNDPAHIIPASPSAPQASYDSNSWQPAPGERGDIARAMFYMDVRYNGAEAYTTDLELVAFAPAGAQMGSLNTLLLWHAEDPPDEAERARNDLIYANYQGNRNPFIDHPELVAAIWGTGIPGDPLNVPLARVEAVAATASENPPSSARIVVSLNQFAGPGGVTVGFQLAGTASLGEFTLGGDETIYDPQTGRGTVRVQQGYATGLVTITPLADGEQEGPETVELRLLGGEGYDITPDASSIAVVTLRDAPSLPVTWNFNSFAVTDKVLPANSGEGSLSLSNWTGTIADFSNPNNNTRSLTLVSSTGNGSWIDFSFSMSGYRDLSLSFWTRGTSSGFTTGTWSFSTDGLSFTTYAGLNTATTGTTFISRTVDFSPFSSLNNAGLVILRYTLSGATSTSDTRADCAHFQARACSRPPDPITSNFMFHPSTHWCTPLARHQALQAHRVGETLSRMPTAREHHCRPIGAEVSPEEPHADSPRLMAQRSGDGGGHRGGGDFLHHLRDFDAKPAFDRRVDAASLRQRIGDRGEARVDEHVGCRDRHAGLAHPKPVHRQPDFARWCGNGRRIVRGKRRHRLCPDFQPRVRRILEQRLDAPHRLHRAGRSLPRHNHCPGALAAFHEPSFHQAAQRLPDGVARDLQRLAQLGLGRQQRADGIGSAADRLRHYRAIDRLEQTGPAGWGVGLQYRVLTSAGEPRGGLRRIHPHHTAGGADHPLTSRMVHGPIFQPRQLELS
jgi:endonuclease I